MFQEGKIGVYEMVSLIVITIIARFFFVIPTQLVQLIGNAAWIETIISGLTTIIAFYFICLLMKRFPGQSLVEILQKVFGTIIGKAIIISFSIYGIGYNAMTLREFNDILKSIALTLTPISVIFVASLLTMIILSYLGLESLARTASFFSIVLLIVLIAIFILPMGNFKTYRFFPLLGYGLDKIFYYGVLGSASWAEVFFLTFFINSFGGIKNFEKIGYISIVISGILITSGLLIYILVFPYYSASEPISGVFQLLRSVSYGRFFQRFEAIFIFEWVLSALISLSMVFYFIVTTFAKAFSLNDYRPLLIPYAVLVFTVALLPPNFSFIVHKAVLFTRLYTWIPAYGIPILALIIAVIRRQKGEIKDA